MPIEYFPRGNIPLYPFLLKVIYVLENRICDHLRQATPTTLAVEPANFLRFLRLAVKFVTSCGFLRQAFYLLALWMFLRINYNLTSFDRLRVLTAQELLAPLLAHALFLGCTAANTRHSIANGTHFQLWKGNRGLTWDTLSFYKSIFI